MSILVITLLLAIIAQVYPQSKIHISIGGGYSAIVHSSEDIKLWKTGYLIELGLGFKIRNNFPLSIWATYQDFSFDGHSLELMGLELTGYRMQVAGQNTRLYSLGAKARIYLPFSSSFIHPLLSAGAAITEIRQGYYVITKWTGGT